MANKQTPLYETHKSLGASFVPFAGWDMPIQYEGIIKEHNHVRNEVGLFDVSHMGEIDIIGPRAQDFCQKLTTFDVTKLKPGKVQYTLVLNDEGGIIDDCTLYMFNEEHYMFVVNASRKENVLNWFYLKEMDGVDIKDQSNKLGLIAVQGPKAPQVVSELINRDVQTITYYEFQVCQVGDHPVIVSRTGYTGEDGFEIYVPWDQTKLVWDALMKPVDGISPKPIGLGARDTLRLEMGYRLFGNDMTEETTPLQAGLSWVVDWNKGNFTGLDALKKQKESGDYGRVRGLIMEEKGIPRPGYKVMEGDDEIGVVTSGTFSPTLQKGIALARIQTPSKVGASLSIQNRGKSMAAKIVKPPFVQGSVKK